MIISIEKVIKSNEVLEQEFSKVVGQTQISKINSIPWYQQKPWENITELHTYHL